MESSLNSKEKLDAFMAEIQPTLPAGICLRRLLPEGLFDDDCFDHLPRFLFLRSDVAVPEPNPIGIDLELHGGYGPFVAAVELYVKVDDKDEHSAWPYSINFVVDDLLTNEEVRTKIDQAASIIAGYRDRKFGSEDLPIDTVGRRLTEDGTGGATRRTPEVCAKNPSSASQWGAWRATAQAPRGSNNESRNVSPWRKTQVTGTSPLHPDTGRRGVKGSKLFRQGQYYKLRVKVPKPWQGSGTSESCVGRTSTDEDGEVARAGTVDQWIVAVRRHTPSGGSRN
jgi:hypothetical protein